jgi:WD40 repeat protein
MCNVFGWPLQFLPVVTLRQRRSSLPFSRKVFLNVHGVQRLGEDDFSSSLTGVTALLPLSPPQGVVVGDKQGILHQQRLTENGPAQTATTTTIEAIFFGRHINGAINRRPSPTFCLTSNNSNGSNGTIIFSGAGDRYVSVWEQDDNGHWVFVDALGPHTGWVRDVLFDTMSGHLYSIGCNCIETWSQSDGGRWEHRGKSTIESSVQEGVTLSSDLLCLCDSVSPYFFSGGVDGRVHVWDSTSMESPCFSYPAHKGRLNAMVYHPRSEVVYTAGNDGQVNCWDLNAFDSDRINLISTFNTGNKDSRITCLAILALEKLCDYLLCGTSNGEVFLLQLQCVGSEEPSLHLVTTFQVMNRPVVHSICVHEQDMEPNLWIGHSRGLSVFPLSNFVIVGNLQ